MWKYVARGIRETLERRVHFRKQDTATGRECKGGALQKRLIPGIVSSNKYDNGNRCKNGPCNDKKHQNRKQHGEKWNSNMFIEDPLFLGALGWSGIVFGWFLGHPVCHRHRAQPSEIKSETQPTCCLKQFVSLFRTLSFIAFAQQPLSILPKRSDRHVPPPLWLLSLPSSSSSAATSSSSSSPEELQLQSSSAISLDTADSVEASLSEPKYGPITAEEALDEAAHNLTKVQKRVTRDIENRLGVACMQLHKYKEAHTYFQRAVQLGCPSAAFNLGLCYESGTGTPQDLKLAAKYYQLASKWGHATAMYNLGVFHVHGSGGVPVDCNRARELFVAAAEMGQTNAQEALAMVPAANSTDSIVHISTELKEPVAVSYEPQRTNILYQMLGILRSRQPVAERPEKPGNKASKTAREDNNNDVYLHNEVTTNNNVPTGCKSVPHFSVIC